MNRYISITFTYIYYNHLLHLHASITIIYIYVHEFLTLGRRAMSSPGRIVAKEPTEMTSRRAVENRTCNCANIHFIIDNSM